MDTFKIKAVLAAAKYKSFSRAAEEFSYTPSAFSHMTSSFEKELGVCLFKRSNSGVELTENGAILCESFEALLEAEKQIYEKAATLQKELTKELKIVTYSSISRTLLPKILTELKAENPEIRLNVRVADNAREWLDNNTADIVFADNYAIDSKDLIPITRDKYYVVTPNGYTDKKQISREELYDSPFLYTDDTFSKLNFEKDRFRDFIVMRSDDDLSILKMIRDGMGISVLPWLLLEGNTEGLSVIEYVPETKRIIGYACRSELRNSQILKSLKRIIRKLNISK